MRQNLLKTIFVSLGLAVLAGCGGGDDQAGSLTPLSVVPDDFAVTAPGVGCPAYSTPAHTTIFVYGGTAPYRLANTVPAWISLDKGQVDHRGESFTVSFTGGCLDPGHIVVIDANDRQVTVTLHYTEPSS